MKPGIIYRIDFQTFKEATAGDVVRYNIYDTSIQIPDEATEVIIELQGHGTPSSAAVIDNDENIHRAIRAKQEVIQFISTFSYDINSFADGPSNRFKVEKLVNFTYTAFLGFLVTSELVAPFLPSGNVIQLVASDQIGLLKDIPLTDDAGDNMTGKVAMSVIIANCMKKTGLSLPFKVINNLRHGSGERTATNIVFSSSGNTITFDFFAGFFYAGMPLVITNSASNNISTTVVSVDSSTQITVVDALVDETATIYNVTFTDASSERHFYEHFLDVLTFEAEIGESEDCYRVLEKILGMSCALTQHNGYWWIYRIDEFDNHNIYVAEFDADGAFISIAQDTTLSRTIDPDGENKIIKADALIRLQEPHGRVRLTYNYRYAKELICNIDFSRGDGAPPDVTNPNVTISQNPGCWDFLREGSPSTGANLDQPPESGAIGELRVRYEYGYEKERYLYTQTAGGFRHYYKSQGFRVRQNDKITFGIDFRTLVDEPITNVFPLHVRLVGDDGTFWDWDYDEPTGISSWNLKTSADAVFDTVWRADLTGLDSSVFRGISAESEPIPTTGTLVVRILNAAGDTIQFLFNNFTATYVPFVNGSYVKYSGEYEQVTNNDPGYLSFLEEEVFIKDAQNEHFLGALFFINGPNYSLTQFWYAANWYDLAPSPDIAFRRPYGWHQVYGVWNQLVNTVTKIPASVLRLGVTAPDVVNKYVLNYNSSRVGNRYFLLISFDQDWRGDITTGLFIECYRTDLGRVYDDTHTFKYITNG